MTGLSVKEQGLGFIFACFEKYQGSWLYGVLILSALILILLYRKKEANFLFGWYPLVLLLTVFNPFLMNFVIEKMDFESEFYRFFWLLPTSVLLSFALVEGAGQMKKNWQRAAVVILMSAVVASGNQDSLSQFLSLQFPKNVYKVEDDLLAVTEIIHRDSQKEQPKVALPLEYNLQARQYDPSLKLTIERNKMMYWLGIDTAGSYSEENASYRYQSNIMEVIYGGRNIHPIVLKRSLHMTHTDYLVAYKKNAVHETIEAAGCTAIGETPDAVVYLTRYGEKTKL